MRIKHIVYIASAAFMIGNLTYFNFVKKEDTKQVYEVSDKVPNKKLKIYNNSQEETFFSIDDNLGKITIINFWATWCGPCIQELPDFNEIYNYYLPTNKVDVIAIHSIDKEDNVDIQAFINNTFSDYNITFAQDENNPNSNDYYTSLGGKGTYPMTVIVNQENVINEVIYGKTTYDNLKNKIDTLLNDSSLNKE